MRAVVVERPGTYDVRDVDPPRPGPGEVTVEVRACGLCGTDVHIAHGEFPPSPYPLIPGHEFAGVVVERGSGVSEPELGARVAVDPTLACGRCDACREGRSNLCAQWGAIGDTVAGGLAERVAVPAANCHPLPPGLGWGEAALIEPLACALWGARRARLRAGDTVVVLGGGTMGLLLAQVLRRHGASRVTVVEPRADRRALALEIGADMAVAPGDEGSGSTDGQSTDRPGPGVRASDHAEPQTGNPRAGSVGFALVADATGRPESIERGLGLVRRGGTFLQFGVAPQGARVPLSPYAVYFNDLTIVGSMAINGTFPAAVRLAPTLALTPLLAPAQGLEAYAHAIAGFGSGPKPKQQLWPGASG